MHKKAFTFVEIILVLGIFVGITTILIPFSLQQIAQSNVASYAANIKTAFAYAQQSALSGKNDDSYGLAFFNNRYEVYRGDTYNTADIRDSFVLPDDITIQNIQLLGGQNAVHFNQGTFKPIQTGTIDIIDSSVVFRITINQEGLITITEL